jgi:hypothetical protein
MIEKMRELYSFFKVKKKVHVIMHVIQIHLNTTHVMRCNEIATIVTPHQQYMWTEINLIFDETLTYHESERILEMQVVS